MKDETLIEQLVEIRALQAVNVFVLQTMLEHMGCDAESLVTMIDQMNVTFANGFESHMRKACGLEPRAEPRTPVLPQIEMAELMRSVRWENMKEQ